MATHSPLFKIGSVIPEDINSLLLGDSLYIEFVDFGSLTTIGDPVRDAARAQVTDKRKNHAIIRVPLCQQTKFAGQNVLGILLSMELVQGSIESNRGVYKMDDTKGVLLLKLINYDEPTHNTLQYYSVKLQSGLRVGHIINAVLYNKLHTFSFSKIGSSYVECRDFVVQFLLRLENYKYCQKNCIESGLPIYNQMAYRYYPLSSHLTPTVLYVEKGNFTDPGFRRMEPNTEVKIYK